MPLSRLSGGELHPTAVFHISAHVVQRYPLRSTAEQNLDLQRDALTKAGCEKIFEDKASGTRVQRPGLNRRLRSVF